MPDWGRRKPSFEPADSEELSHFKGILRGGEIHPFFIDFKRIWYTFEYSAV